MTYLKAVYFPGPSGFDNLHYRKALVYKEDVDYFLKMGATLQPPDEGMEAPPVVLMPETAEPTPQDVDADIVPMEEKEPSIGDRGDGKPGTFQWHKTQIDSMRVKKQIVNYVGEIAGAEVAKEIDDSKPLTVIKLRAKKLIKEFLNNDDQG